MSESNILEFTQALVAKGDLQAAENALQARLRLPPVPEGAYLLLTEILIRQAKYAGAVQFVNEHPDNAEIFVRLRDYFIGERMNEPALQLIAASRLGDPGISHVNDSVQRQLGGDLPAAIAACNKALRFNAQDASAYNQLGRVLFNAGHPRQSQSAFEKALTLKPRFAEAWHNLGHVLRAQNKLEEAEKAYVNSVSLAPYYRSGLLNLGVIKFACGKKAEALENFHSLLALDPDHVDGHINAGVAQHILRNGEQAKTHYLRAISLDAGNETALRNLANLYHDENDQESAVEYFRKTLAINPRLSDVWAQLIEIHESAGHPEQARQALAQARQTLPDDADILYVAAKCEAREDQIGQSVDTFGKIDPRLLHSRFLQPYYFEFARALDSAGNYQRAYDNFEKGNDLATLSARGARTDFHVFDRHMDAIEQWLQDGAPVEKYESGEYLGADLCFMLGFPCSDNDLLDAMLAHHPKAQVLESRTTFEHIAAIVDRQYGGYPSGMSKIGPAERQDLREQYLALLENEGIKRDGNGIVVDKMPIRTIHAACLHRLFPRAKFLFALRHPCDVILDNYRKNFGPDEILVHFNTLAESARIYERVMRIWKTSTELMPIPVHFARHEKLAGNAERPLQDVCRFLDLAWTGSANPTSGQRKERTNGKSGDYPARRDTDDGRLIQPWKKYRTQLAPHLAKIKPYADYFSYSLD